MNHLISSSALVSVIKAEKNNKGAKFTIKSKKTGKEFTYSISRSEFKNKWYTHIRVEKQYNKFVYLGSYFKGKLFHKGQRISTPAGLAIAHVLGAVEAGLIDKVDEQIELMHTGNCLRCNRDLSTAESIARGLGPTCATLV